MFTWGTNERGQLGRSRIMLEESSSDDDSEDNDEKHDKNTDMLRIYYDVERVKGAIDGEMVIQVSCGSQFTVVVTNDGRVRLLCRYCS